MRRTSPQCQGHPTARSRLLRWGGLAACLAGVLFVVWGYVHRESAPVYFDAASKVLAVVVPALFTLGLAALYARCAGRTPRLGETSIILGFIGSTLGVAEGLMGIGPWSALDTVRDIQFELWVWMPTLFGGVVLTGVAVVGAIRRLGMLLLAIGLFGWGYYFADSGGILEERTVHLACGALFSLGWVALGLALWKGGVRQIKGPSA
jgi:hypothetical protein